MQCAAVCECSCTAQCDVAQLAFLVSQRLDTLIICALLLLEWQVVSCIHTWDLPSM